MERLCIFPPLGIGRMGHKNDNIAMGTFLLLSFCFFFLFFLVGTDNFALLIKGKTVGRCTMLSHHDDENFVLGFMDWSEMIPSWAGVGMGGK